MLPDIYNFSTGPAVLQLRHTGNRIYVEMKKVSRWGFFFVEMEMAVACDGDHDHVNMLIGCMDPVDGCVSAVTFSAADR